MQHAHNEWLELACESGFLPPLIMACFVLMLLWRWLKAPAGAWDLVLEASLIAMLCHSLVDFNFHAPVLILGAALMLGARERFDAAWSPELEKQGRNSAVQGLLALALASILLGHFLAPIFSSPKQEAEMASSYLKARALDPLEAEWPSLYGSYLVSPGAEAGNEAMAVIAELQALRIAPESATAHLRYALLLRQISLEHLDEDRLRHLGDLLPGWEALPDESRGKKFEDLYHKEFETALAWRPFDARWHLLAAQLAQADGDLEGMQKRLDETVALEPHFAGAWEFQARSSQARSARPRLLAALHALKAIESMGYEDFDLYSLQLRNADWDWIHQQFRSSKEPGLWP
jgi:hypothetical protein